MTAMKEINVRARLLSTALAGALGAVILFAGGA
jgi:hypothetical protein